MKSNLELWGKVEKTPADIVRDTQIDGKTFKTTAPINKIKKATEIFGAYGDKWGLRNISHSEKTIFQSLVIGVLDAEFYYTNESDVEVSFSISNSISIVSTKDKQLQVNFSYRKALETDTISKALSRLGFNADLYTDGEILDVEEKIDGLDGVELIDIKGGANG